MKSSKSSIVILAPIFLYLILIIPYLGTIPYLDGNIDLVKSHEFYRGGFKLFLESWKSFHPPLKEILSAAFFKIFGINALSYSLIGPTLAIVGIAYFYKLLNSLFGKNAAIIGALLLAANPLFVSVSMFSLIDFMLSVLVIISLYYYSVNNLLAYAIFGSLAFLAKETGLTLAVAVLFTELIFHLFNKGVKLTKNKIFLFAPVIVAFSWYLFLKFEGKSIWSDWNFSKTAEQGTLYTIFSNLLTFNFLNKYAYQNWLELFVLNFNWIYWSIVLLGLISNLIKARNVTNMVTFKLISNKLKEIFANGDKNKIIFAIIVFSLAYILSVLSFQTYTITRYGLPIIPFMLTGVAFSLELARRLMKSKVVSVYAFVAIIVFVSAFSSQDPVSLKIWGKEEIFGEKLYALNKHLAGNDGLTYNIQYLQIVKKRSDILTNGAIVDQNQYTCHWMFADRSNDTKTAKILSINDEVLRKCKII